ncbi:hypothetical protein DFW101_1688 [Solidesulfovibrio carbinoliphilus subsp. oakridgensis]|uniref:Zinc resistance-associated protein n=1 Tax=Solidesulfovibrio carbinoliphilus subsp. oakridgensis TaxID=694327 RepID=G7Q802_9BACT|nr:periplasmic heavy metal sensor [Solidesulfovibrio carbinoliphilus]EHJ47696.1 hypothetical protein DFW101_1688 [Solidesulfovibrio carbinoliphilus subsp. oakridgensis]
MRNSIRIPAILALTLALAVPALAQTPMQHPAGGAMAMPAAKAVPAADPAKADLLHQEFVAKTAELHGRITAREAELEAQLATNPDETAAVKKLTADIATLRGQLFEQATLFRIRYAKETGTPIRDTRGVMGHMGKGMMMGGKGMDGGCMMMGKGMMGGHGMGKGAMPGMDMGGMDMAKDAAPAGTAKTN